MFSGIANLKRKGTLHASLQPSRDAAAGECGHDGLLGPPGSQSPSTSHASWHLICVEYSSLWEQHVYTARPGTWAVGTNAAHACCAVARHERHGSCNSSCNTAGAAPLISLACATSSSDQLPEFNRGSAPRWGPAARCPGRSQARARQLPATSGSPDRKWRQRSTSRRAASFARSPAAAGSRRRWCSR